MSCESELRRIAQMRADGGPSIAEKAADEIAALRFDRDRCRSGLEEALPIVKQHGSAELWGRLSALTKEVHE